MSNGYRKWRELFPPLPNSDDGHSNAYKLDLSVVKPQHMSIGASKTCDTNCSARTDSYWTKVQYTSAHFHSGGDVMESNRRVVCLEPRKVEHRVVAAMRKCLVEEGGQ